MKGLLFLPSQKDLEKAYEGLQQPVPAQDLTLFTQWSRFDPRLGEILVSHFARFWREYNPLEISKLNQLQPWPAALGVLLEFCERSLKISQVKDMKSFCLWKDLILEEVSLAPEEQYFIGLRKLAGKLMFQDVRGSLQEYRKWGFLGREVLLNKAQAIHLSTSSPPGRLSPKVRKQILEDLLEAQPEITVNDYLQATQFLISRRQAERDLKPRAAKLEALRRVEFIANNLLNIVRDFTQYIE